jgi:hypothetical protein
MSDIPAAELMCSAEIQAISIRYQIKLASMQAANHAREEQGHSHAYGEDLFRELADELESEVTAMRRHWLG